MKSSNWLTYGLFLLVSVGGGLLIGANNIPGPWYQALVKPPFTPPNWLFGPAWTFLYILIGIVGARVYRSKGSKDLLLLWFIQMGLNFTWSPVFFTLKNLTGSVAIISFLLLIIISFIAMARKRDPIASSLFVPYLLWVGYASYLNISIWLLN
ncbi:TspO/MBR family protein [uncultured Cohaesibacter sp.]|uniref:TspO/MBR family protein n=1 Tax=uncultured Cohaesibacter sp. TaxID=1002546 RepID=UPI002AA7C6B0|nr:TspO/MBR family protein [uncultured Cohaesibacter sp.]